MTIYNDELKVLSFNRSKDKTLSRQRSNNEEILRKLREGESLASIDMRESWFPKRKIISKNKKDIERLYGSDVEHLKEYQGD